MRNTKTITDMKKIILATLAAASLVACAQENVIDSAKPEAIAFNNAFVDNTTKSIDPSITTDNLGGFLVYGTTQGDHATDAAVINIFDGILVEGSKASNVWAYDVAYTQYWIKDNKYNFAAVVNSNDPAALAPALVECDGNGMPKTLTYTADGETDLLYARSAEYTGQTSGNPQVAFTFDHLLSKVKFSFKNQTLDTNNASSYTYRVSNIVMTGTPVKATCTLGVDENTGNNTYAWTTTTTGATTTYGHIVDTDAETDAVKVGPETTKYSKFENLVIPGTYNVNITCTIELLIGEQVADVINYNETTEVTLKQGVAYNFVLTGKLGEPIEFTVTKVKDWNNPAVDVPTPEDPTVNYPAEEE